MNCSSEDKYPKGVRCCDRCSAGTYVQADCDGTKVTRCDKCRHGFYTATKNHLTKCHPCKECSSKNNQRKSKNCSASEDTECECETGFYCSNDQCDHCQPVTQCPVGEGVQVPANRTSDTICAPCEEGSYSNVTDFISRCKTHTRCTDFGRELKLQGTKTTNSICSDVLPRCSWMLPAGLWAGLVLTALVLLAIVVWRAKRRAVKVGSGVPVTAEVGPVSLVMLPDQPSSFTEPNGHCQESCAMEECKLTVISPESRHNTAAAGYRTGNFQRSHSEPQEDEWCGT